MGKFPAIQTQFGIVELKITLVHRMQKDKLMYCREPVVVKNFNANGHTLAGLLQSVLIIFHNQLMLLATLFWNAK